jgi:hypothetical protein
MNHLANAALGLGGAAVGGGLGSTIGSLLEPFDMPRRALYNLGRSGFNALSGEGTHDDLVAALPGVLGLLGGAAAAPFTGGASIPIGAALAGAAQYGGEKMAGDERFKAATPEDLAKALGLPDEGIPGMAASMGLGMVTDPLAWSGMVGGAGLGNKAAGALSKLDTEADLARRGWKSLKTHPEERILGQSFGQQGALDTPGYRQFIKDLDEDQLRHFQGASDRAEMMTGMGDEPMPHVAPNQPTKVSGGQALEQLASQLGDTTDYHPVPLTRSGKIDHLLDVADKANERGEEWSDTLMRAIHGEGADFFPHYESGAPIHRTLRESIHDTLPNSIVPHGLDDAAREAELANALRIKEAVGENAIRPIPTQTMHTDRPMMPIPDEPTSNMPKGGNYFVGRNQNPLAGPVSPHETMVTHRSARPLGKEEFEQLLREVAAREAQTGRPAGMQNPALFL